MDKTETLEPREHCRKQRSFAEALKQNAWLAIATVIYLVTLYLVQEHPEWSSWTKITLKVLPVFPGLVYLWMGLKAIRVLDELQRRIQLEAWLFAAIGTVVVSTVINVLNANGVQWEKFPFGLEIGGTYLVMFFMWCVGTAYANSRYR